MAAPSAGATTTLRQRVPKPTPRLGRAATLVQPPMRRGPVADRSAPPSGCSSVLLCKAIARRSVSGTDGRQASDWRRRKPERWTVKRSVVLSSSTIFFCTGGGEFLYRFQGPKRQTLGRGHKERRQHPNPEPTGPRCVHEAWRSGRGGA